MSINRPNSGFLIAILSAATLALTSSAVSAQSGNAGSQNPNRGTMRPGGAQLVRPPVRPPVQRPQQQSTQPRQSSNNTTDWNQNNQSQEKCHQNTGPTVHHNPWGAPYHYPMHQSPWGVPQYPGPHADLPQPGTFPVSPYYSPYGPGWYQGMGTGGYSNPHGGLNQTYSEQQHNSSGFPPFQNY